MRILGKASSINVRKVLWTCRELQIDFRREDWGSGFAATDTPEFLAMNPNGQVPVIEDEAGVLWESNTICRYLAARHARTDLLPNAARARAEVEMWMDWQATELNTAWRYAFLGLVRNHPGHQDADRLAAGIADWNRTMGILERRLESTQAYAVGPEFTLADVVLGLSVNRWLMTPIERPDYPATRAYHALLLRRPGFVEFGANGIP